MLTLLHPVGLDHDCWQFTDLVATTPDYPGHGGRQFEPNLYTLESIADEITNTYDSPLDLVGVSMGSHVAQYIAVRNPGRVRSLMLCCGTAGRTKEEAEVVTSDERTDETLRLGMSGIVESTMRRWFSAQLLAQPDHPAIAYARNRLLTDNVEAVAASWLALRRNAVFEELAAVKVPTTVLGGRGDQAATPEAIQRLADAIPSARLEMIDGPHMLHLEQPREFSSAVRRHLAWVDQILGAVTA